MTLFLAVHSTYTTVEIGLFQENKLLAKKVIEHTQASKELIPTIALLLETQGLSLVHLTFIAANQGPGPFTTLRTVIATVNGLAFSTHIPLVGVDSLEALLEEHANLKFPFTVALLNAFGQDVYYAIQENSTITKGTEKASLLLATLMHRYPSETVRFIGNGVRLYSDAIQHVFSANIVLPEPLPDYCSLEFLGQKAYTQWQRAQNVTDQLLPIYLKAYSTPIG
jgi:tRNA threonylcarbamoyladenosine biosynthesis protein TsaB